MGKWVAKLECKDEPTVVGPPETFIGKYLQCQGHYSIELGRPHYHQAKVEWVEDSGETKS